MDEEEEEVEEEERIQYSVNINLSALVAVLVGPSRARVFNLKLGICIIAAVNDQHF